MKDFKPRLIQQNDEGIKASIQTANNNAQSITSNLKTVLDFIGEPLTDSELIELLEGGKYESVMQKVRTAFTFPNATDNFNLEALGKVGQSKLAEKAFKNASRLFYSYNFDLKDGVATLPEDEVENIKRSFMVFTVSQRQNDMMDKLEGVCNDLIYLFNEGIIRPEHRQYLRTGLVFMRDGKEKPFDVKPQFIKKYK